MEIATSSRRDGAKVKRPSRDIKVDSCSIDRDEDTISGEEFEHTLENRQQTSQEIYHAITLSVSNKGWIEPRWRS
jgi:hypothetical protein